MISLHSRLLLGNSSSFPQFVVCSFCLLINCVFVCDVGAMVGTLLCELGAGWFWNSPLLLRATLLHVWSIHSHKKQNKKTGVEKQKSNYNAKDFCGIVFVRKFAVLQIRKTPTNFCVHKRHKEVYNFFFVCCSRHLCTYLCSFQLIVNKQLFGLHPYADKRPRLARGGIVEDK